MSDSPVTKRKRDSRCARRTGGVERTSSMPPLLRWFCKTTWILECDAFPLSSLSVSGRLGVLAAAAIYFGFGRIREPFKGYAAAEQFVELPSGSSPPAIGERLVAAGVVRDPLTFRAALLFTGRARELKAGEYRFDRADVARRGHRQDRARRCLPPSRHISRGPDAARDGQGV